MRVGLPARISPTRYPSPSCR